MYLIIMSSIHKAVILAAGFGTRMLPATKAQPKEMLTVINKPVMQYIIEELVASGITSILIVLGRSKEPIVNHFDHHYELEESLAQKGKNKALTELQALRDNDIKIHFIRQPKMRGTASAVREAEDFVGSDPFVMVYGDDIVSNRLDNPANKAVIRQRIDAYDKHYDAGVRGVMAVREVSDSDVSKYGIVATSEQLDDTSRKMSGIVEKPTLEEAPSRLASMGGCILPAQIFDYIDQIEPGAGGEYVLVDAIAKMMSDQNNMMATTFEWERFDIGNPQWFLEANIAIAMKSTSPVDQEKLREFMKQYTA